MDDPSSQHYPFSRHCKIYETTRKIIQNDRGKRDQPKNYQCTQNNHEYFQAVLKLEHIIVENHLNLSIM